MGPRQQVEAMVDGHHDDIPALTEADAVVVG
jgi:hypothetical protein